MTWVDKTLNELNQKPKNEWTQSDWETYHYCQQVKFENGDYEE